MNTGSKQSVSAAAEALFETKNVADIRKIEAQTRREIEEKNQQLRQLVGNSYRDLIEGTDKIIDISTKCHNILNSILSVQESFGSLALSVSGTAGAQEGKDYVRKHQELHAVGSRVKLILDTPEVIWGCLDEQQHLEAARRLLHVHEVHHHLQSAYATDVAAKFPLLSHQWPQVMKFRQQIIDIATNTLSTKPELSSQTAADAVAAVALLQDLDSAAALQRFLSCRKQWAVHHLEQACSATQLSRQDPGAVLAELAQQVQTCITQVGELFTDNRPSASKLSGSNSKPSSSSLLQQLLQEDDAAASELYFGMVTASSEGGNSPEAVAWRQRIEEIRQQLRPLQRQQVAQACSAWLSDVAAACNQHGAQLLQLCSSPQSLLEAEHGVQLALAEWTLAPADTADESDASADIQSTSDKKAMAADIMRSGSGSVNMTNSGPALPSLLAIAAASRAGSSPRALAGRTWSEWDAACELIMGQKLDLWQILFHQPFLGRCKGIIGDALKSACTSISEPLRAAMQAAAQHDAEAAGQLQPGKWPSILAHSSVSDAMQLDRTFSSFDSRTTSGAWNAGSHSLAYSQSGAIVGVTSCLPEALRAMADEQRDGFRSEVTPIKQLFDAQLHAALQATLLLTASADDTVSGFAQAARNTSVVFGNSSAPSRTSSIASNINRTSSTAAAGTASQSGAQASSSLANTAAAAATAACSAAGKARSAELQQYTQQQCIELVQSLAGNLQQQLQELPAVENGIQGAPVVEQVLLLARVCNVLATNSTMLPALLGSPDAWLTAYKAGPDAAANNSSGSSNNPLPASLAQGVSALGPAAAALLRMHHPGLLGQGATSAPSAAAAQLAAIQQQLHGVASNGYATWAAWVAGSLSSALLMALKHDELLYSDVTSLSWVETRLAADGDSDAATAGLLDPLDAAAVGEMKFLLPGSPSSALVHMLSLACWETRRAGEQLISTDALQLLQWELHGATLEVLQQLVNTISNTNSSVSTAPFEIPSAQAASAESKSISEKGVLQLLFDQRLVRDVLGGGKPAGASTAAVPNGVTDSFTAARKKLVTAVEQQLQDHLDPIDWATYEPHLWANVQRYYQRTSVLLGTLNQLHKPYADAPRTPAQSSTEFNTLNLLPVAPRFHYLPVGTPTAASLHGGMAGKQKRGGLANIVVAGLSAGLAALPASAGVAGAGAAATGQLAGASGTPLSSITSDNNQASDLAAQYVISELGSGSSTAKKAAPGAAGKAAGQGVSGAAATASGLFVGAAGQQLHLSADAAAAAGASALSALHAKLQGSSFSALGTMLGDRAAEVTAMAQNFGDLLPSSGIGGGLLSSFSRREGAQQFSASGSRK